MDTSKKETVWYSIDETVWYFKGTISGTLYLINPVVSSHFLDPGKSLILIDDFT